MGLIPDIKAIGGSNIMHAHLYKLGHFAVCKGGGFQTLVQTFPREFIHISSNLQYFTDWGMYLDTLPNL